MPSPPGDKHSVPLTIHWTITKAFPGRQTEMPWVCSFYSKNPKSYPTDRRQLGKGPPSLQGVFRGGAQKVSPVKRVELQASGKRAGAKRTKISFGPHTIPKNGVVSIQQTSIQQG